MKKFMTILYISLFLASLSYAKEEMKGNSFIQNQVIPALQEALIKKIYISPRQLNVRGDGIFIHQVDNSVIRVEDVGHDHWGLYYVVGGYGDCPNGHPYGLEGGCYGPPECPYSNQR